MAMGARLGKLEQDQAVTESRYSALQHSVDSIKEDEKAMSGLINDIYRMMSEMKVDIAKLTTKSNYENSARERN